MKNKAIQLVIHTMKLSIYVFVVQVLALNLLLASHTKGQKTLSVKEAVVSISLSKASLSDIFGHLESVSDYHFNYNGIDINSSKKLDLDFRNARFADVLLEISKKHQLGFRQLNDVIQVVSYSQINHEDIAEVIMVDVEISGKITDENGEGLPGATVVVKGTTEGSTSDIDGNYKLSVPEGATIMVSFVGYSTQELLVGSQSVIDVRMELDAEQLEEVVVVGYGTQKKANMTAAVTQINSKELGNITTTSIAATLQGRLPGLYIRDAGYNQGLSFLVRGQTTIGNSSPLFIVDGIPQDSYNLDPNDIETISVLKDGAASSIYGARASAGVVLITTKTGKEGKTNFNYETFTSWSNLTTVNETTNSLNSAEIMNEASINSGGEPLFTPEQIDLFKSGTDHYYADVNWADEFLKTERTTRHYLSASGGNEKTSYLFSLGYKNDNGITNGIDRNKYTLRSNLKTKLTDKVELAANLGYTLIDNTSPNVNGGLDNIFQHMQGIAPFMPVYQSEEDGGGFQHFNQAGSYGRGFWNVMWELEAGSQNTVGNSFVANTSLTWEIIKGVKFTGRYSAIFGNSNTESHVFKRSTTGGPPWFSDVNSLSRRYDSNRQLNYQNFLSYEKSIGDHSFSVMGGWDVQFNKSSYLSGGRRNFQFDQLLTELDAPNSGDNDDITSLSSNTSESALQSAVGRINYNFAGKYLLEVTGRYDGSSNFAPETRYGFFPAVSAGWMISDESFFGSSLFDYMKIRASYGSSGNNRVNGNYFSAVSFGTYYFGAGDIVSQTAAEGGIPFRGLRWESTTTTNLGVEFSIKEKLLSGEIDVYNKVTDDILLGSPVQGVVGTNRSGPAINAGKVKNTGVEMILTHANKLTNDLNYTISLNGTYNKNEIVELTDAFSEYGDTRVGDPLGAIYGYISEGILSSTSEADAYATTISSGLHPNTSAGDIRYKDINGDGVLNSEDRVLIGETLPRIIWGLRMQANWKNFDLQLFFQGVGKAQQYKSTDLFGNYGWIPVEAEDRWNESNTDGTYPRALLFAQQTYFQNFYTQSDYWAFNAAYLRLKNVQLGYTIPLPENKFVKSARVYFTSTNPWTVSSFRPGFDPESSGLGIPPIKTYTVGLNVKF